MGNSPNLIPQKIAIPYSFPKQAKTINVPKASSSNFVPRINKILNQPPPKQSQYPKQKLQFQYLHQKQLNDESLDEIQNTNMRASLTRKNAKQKILFYEQEQRSNSTRPSDDINSEKEKSNLTMKYNQNVVLLDQQLGQNKVKQITLILQNHFLFQQLNEVQKLETVKGMNTYKAEKGTYVFREGDIAERFFIIDQGQVEIIIEGQIRKKLHKHQSFGEIALLFGTKRTASVRTLTDCLFWGIDRLTFKGVVYDINQKSEKQNRQFLEKTSFFSFLTPVQQHSVIHTVITLEYRAGETIVNKGDQANSFYIIKSGQVAILKQNQEQIVLTAGSQFGEKSLQEENAKRIATVKAVTNCSLISIGRNEITEALGSSVKKIILKNRVRMAFEKSKLFRSFVNRCTQELLEGLEIRKVGKDERVLKKGHTMRNFYIPLNCKFTSVNKQYEIGEIIEQFLIIDKKPLLHGIKSETNGEMLVIKVPISLITQASKLAQAVNLETIKLKDIQIIRKIGAGQFGEVFAALHFPSNSLIAIKVISKKKVQDLQIQKHIVNEQTVMKTINHPFIIKYYNTFVDKKEIYFALEYIAGRQFFDIIRSIGLLNVGQTRFYAAQIILALQYMHNQNIVYRDLKPENIMMDKSGYLKVIDMGTAKYLRKQSYYKTRTIIGTPHYMAPETITGKGYSFLCDLWSLGVVIYELVCGFLPYEEKVDDPFEIFKYIIHKKPQFPKHVKDEGVKQFIFKLLNKSPGNRMSKGYNELKSMEFFDSLDWEGLQSKKLPPPYMIEDKVGIELQNVHRQSLNSVQEYFEKKRVVKEAKLNSTKKQISWSDNLL